MNDREASEELNHPLNPDTANESTKESIVAYSQRSLISDTDANITLDPIRYGWIRRENCRAEFIEVPLGGGGTIQPERSLLKYQTTFKSTETEWLEKMVERLASKRRVQINSLFKTQGGTTTKGITKGLLADGVIVIPGVSKPDSMRVTDDLSLAIVTANTVLNRLGTDLRLKRIEANVQVYRDTHDVGVLPESDYIQYIKEGLAELSEDNFLMTSLQLKEE